MKAQISKGNKNKLSSLNLPASFLQGELKQQTAAKTNQHQRHLDVNPGRIPPLSSVLSIRCFCYGSTEWDSVCKSRRERCVMSTQSTVCSPNLTSSVCFVHKASESVCSRIAARFTWIKRFCMFGSANTDALSFWRPAPFILRLFIPCSEPPESLWVWVRQQTGVLQQSSRCSPTTRGPALGAPWTGRAPSPGGPSPDVRSGTSWSAEKMSLRWSLILERSRRRRPGNICETAHKHKQQL